MNDNIQDLERKLDQARKEQEHLQEQLAEYKELEGKVFLTITTNGRKTSDGKWMGVALTHYKKVHVPEHRDEVCWSGESISSIFDNGNRNGIYVNTHRDETFGTYFNIHSRTRINMKEYRKAKAYAKVAGASLMEYFKTLHDQVAVIEVYEPKETLREGPDLDLPYIQLKNGEVTVLSRTPFTLLNNRYLITPASVKMGRDLIREREADLSRGSEFHQECDQRYLTSTRAMLDRLRKKLNEWHLFPKEGE